MEFGDEGLGAIAFAFLLCLRPEDKPDVPTATGSESVIVNGQPAKRAGDIPGAILSPNVFVNGQPVIIGCSEGTPVLSPNVFVNGKPKILDCAK